jgi:hypothetical protein
MKRNRRPATYTRAATDGRSRRARRRADIFPSLLHLYFAQVCKTFIVRRFPPKPSVPEDLVKLNPEELAVTSFDTEPEPYYPSLPGTDGPTPATHCYDCPPASFPC